MGKQSRKGESGGGLDPLTVTLAGVLVIVAVAAAQVYWTAGAVIEAAQDKNTYVLFVTDGGIASDNAQLEDKVNTGLRALGGARQMAMALLVVCLALGVALGVRVGRGVGRDREAAP